MLIQEIDENKKRYLHLLLLADEQEDMVDRYLERGTMYVLTIMASKLNALSPMRAMVYWKSRTLLHCLTIKNRVMPENLLIFLLRNTLSNIRCYKSEQVIVH